MNNEKLCPYCGFSNLIPVIPKKDLIKSVNADASTEGKWGRDWC